MIISKKNIIKDRKSISKKSGFTLIELLVVIPIIGLLSSVVLVNVNNARGSARDVAIKQMVGEYVKLMELEYVDTGSYTNLATAVQPTFAWMRKPPLSLSSHMTCDSSTSIINQFRAIAGANRDQAVNVCKGIIQNMPSTRIDSTSNEMLLVYSPTGGQSFSIMAYLPHQSEENGDTWVYCYGSSGRKSVVDFADSEGVITAYTQPGCTNNP